MGLRQHPGPPSILGLGLIFLLASGCARFPASTASLASRDQSSTDLTIGVDLPAHGSPPPDTPGPAPAPGPTPPPPLILSPLDLAMQRATSHYERGLQAMRSGNADQAEWEFDAGLEALLEMSHDGHAPPPLLETARPAPFPASPWVGSLAAPPRSLPPDLAEPAEKAEPTLEAPALLGPEDQQAITEEQPEAAAPLPEPDVNKHDIPIVFNDQVKTFTHYFQTRKWGVISRAFERASRYLPLMRPIFREKGLPDDLLNLAFIESAVNPRATSRAKAAGIWQFIPSTGRRFGMRTSWWLDERRDPEKSARGAAKYLKTLHTMFGDWPLALAAYNAGEGKIQAAIQRQRTRDFWKLRLPRETRLFVPAFMAMTIIAREPERYGFSPPPEDPLEADMVILDRPTELKIVAQAAGSTVEEIRDLNPELIRWATPPDLSRYAVRIPAGRSEEFAAALEQIPPEARFTWIRHKIRRGETPASIARRYGVDLQAFLEINGLRKRQALKSGVTLLVPPSQAGRVVAIVEEPRQPRQAVARPAAATRYTVKRGDTLGEIARDHAVSLEDLRRWNGLPGDAAIRPGQTLKVSPSPATDQSAAGPRTSPGSRTPRATPVLKRYVVKRGDTLWEIARDHAVSLEDLRLWNGLPGDAAIRPGQELEIRASAS